MLIVGIAGGTGSGKTTVVKKVKERFPNEEVIVIPQDADIIIPGGGENQVGIEVLISIIEKHLQ